MCKYCGATQIEEVNGRVICSYCKSPQPDIKPISKPKQIISDDLLYTNLFKGCVTLPAVTLNDACYANMFAGYTSLSPYIQLIPKPSILQP